MHKHFIVNYWRQMVILDYSGVPIGISVNNKFFLLPEDCELKENVIPKIGDYYFNFAYQDWVMIIETSFLKIKEKYVATPKPKPIQNQVTIE